MAASAAIVEPTEAQRHVKRRAGIPHEHPGARGCSSGRQERSTDTSRGRTLTEWHHGTTAPRHSAGPACGKTAGQGRRCCSNAHRCGTRFGSRWLCRRCRWLRLPRWCRCRHSSAARWRRRDPTTVPGPQWLRGGRRCSKGCAGGQAGRRGRPGGSRAGTAGLLCHAAQARTCGAAGLGDGGRAAPPEVASIGKRDCHGCAGQLGPSACRESVVTATCGLRVEGSPAVAGGPSLRQLPASLPMLG